MQCSIMRTLFICLFLFPPSASAASVYPDALLCSMVRGEAHLNCAYGSKRKPGAEEFVACYAESIKKQLALYRREGREVSCSAEGRKFAPPYGYFN